MKSYNQEYSVISSQVSTIIEALSLTISQAAKVLAVTRPTIYAWNNSNDFLDIELKDHQRLKKVYEVANEWNSYGLGPMGERNLMLFEDDRKSILGYLSSEELSPQLLKKISDRMKIISDPNDKSGLLIKIGTNWREAFKRMGIVGPTTEQQDAIQSDNLNRLSNDY